MLLGYFYFSLNIEGKGKRDEHIISQIIFTRCLRLTLRTSKMPNPQLTRWPGLVSLGREHNKFSDFFSFLLTCPNRVEESHVEQTIETGDDVYVSVEGSEPVLLRVVESDDEGTEPLEGITTQVGSQTHIGRVWGGASGEAYVNVVP